MISKETFVRTMEELEALDTKMDAVDSALKALDPDFGGFYVGDIFDITLAVLAEDLNDVYEWLPYFVWELDWLKDFRLGDITIAGEPVQIDGWADVYDFITSEDKTLDN